MGRDKYEFEKGCGSPLVPSLLLPGTRRLGVACPGVHAAPPSGPGKHQQQEWQPFPGGQTCAGLWGPQLLKGIEGKRRSIVQRIGQVRQTASVV